eukprot:1625356-Amphidinium_carterae.1
MLPQIVEHHADLNLTEADQTHPSSTTCPSNLQNCAEKSREEGKRIKERSMSQDSSAAWGVCRLLTARGYCET